MVLVLQGQGKAGVLDYKGSKFHRIIPAFMLQVNGGKKRGKIFFFFLKKKKIREETLLMATARAERAFTGQSSRTRTLS